MQHNNCLNCGTELAGRFCFACGQKANTHRITAKHFLMHDLIHGVWHLDRGMLYTLKALFIRPGYMAKEYIEGKRVQYYNIFYLLLLMFAVIFFVESWMGTHQDSFHYKATYLTFIPIYASLGFLFFRRMKYNFFEHIIVAAVVVFWQQIINLISIIEPEATSINMYYAMTILHIIVAFLFPTIIYYQLTKEKFKPLGILWRIICIVVIATIFHNYFVSYTGLLIRSVLKWLQH